MATVIRASISSTARATAMNNFNMQRLYSTSSSSSSTPSMASSLKQSPNALLRHNYQSKEVSSPSPSYILAKETEHKIRSKLPPNARKKSFAHSYFSLPPRTRMKIGAMGVVFSLAGLYVSSYLEEEFPADEDIERRKKELDQTRIEISKRRKDLQRIELDLIEKERELRDLRDDNVQEDIVHKEDIK